jgi:hypothetical protein
MSLSQSARAELVAFYNFNDASNSDVAADVTGRGNDGDIYVAEYTADGEGHTGAAGDRALDFGTYDNGAYVEIVSAADGAFESLTEKDMFTISMWIYGSDEQPSPQWTFFAGPGRQIGAHTPWSDQTIYYDVAGCCGANQRISLNEPDPAKWMGEWNNYVFVKNETYTAIYQNGELFHDSGEDEKDPIADILEFYIGSGPPSDQRSYSGLIDDFAIFDEVLSDEDILKIYNNTYPFPGGGAGTPGDFDNNGALDAADIDALSNVVRLGTNEAKYDVTGDNLVNAADRDTWVNTLKKTYYGDANLDGEFNSADFVVVFTVGKYESNNIALWAEGDWNGDTKFDSSDFVTAFQAGGYEVGPRPAVSSVPEPAGALLMLSGLLLAALRCRK